MKDDEEMMASEILLPHQAFHWLSKYTPLKPVFFNKVKMGFDWNQFNQVHYDAKNPPPKVIQGYRFNLFYPELRISRSDRRLRRCGEMMTCRLVPDKEDDNWCTIRFHAGAPYEDVAFRVSVGGTCSCRS